MNSPKITNVPYKPIILALSIGGALPLLLGAMVKCSDTGRAHMNTPENCPDCKASWYSQYAIPCGPTTDPFHNCTTTYVWGTVTEMQRTCVKPSWGVPYCTVPVVKASSHTSNAIPAVIISGSSNQDNCGGFPHDN